MKGGHYGALRPYDSIFELNFINSELLLWLDFACSITNNWFFPFSILVVVLEKFAKSDPCSLCMSYSRIGFPLFNFPELNFMKWRLKFCTNGVNSYTKNLFLQRFDINGTSREVPQTLHWRMTYFSPEPVFCGFLVIDDLFQIEGTIVIFVLPFTSSVQNFSPWFMNIISKKSAGTTSSGSPCDQPSSTYIAYKQTYRSFTWPSRNYTHTSAIRGEKKVRDGGEVGGWFESCLLSEPLCCKKPNYDRGA